MKIHNYSHAACKTARVRNMLLALFVSVGIGAGFLGITAGAQAPARAAQKPDANLLQLMRGILYPSSNVIFAAQSDISKIPPAADPSISPNPLTNTYGGWTAVENASLALSEASYLVVIPGRVCSNGKPVPVERADWQKFAQGLRQAGLDTYKAAQSKSTDNMVDAAGEVTDACSACHNVYRDKKGGVADRCTP